MTDPELIYDAVTSDAMLLGLVGTRVFPVVIPAKLPDGSAVPMPAVTYALVTQPTDFTQDGAQFRWPRWRFRIYSLLYRDLVPIATALAAIFGDQTRTPFERSWIEYPATSAEGHETETNRFWRALDVVAFSPAGAASQ
jgi:hypothetical protein